MLDETETVPASSSGMVSHIHQSNAALKVSNRAIGTKLIHESAVRHVNGSALYVDDIPPPDGTLHAYFGFTEVARGRILKIDLAAQSTKCKYATACAKPEY